MNIENIDWDNLDLDKLDDKKVDFIYDNAIQFLNQKREVYSTNSKKAQSFLTLCITLLTAVGTIYTILLTQGDFGNSVTIVHWFNVGFYSVLGILSATACCFTIALVSRSRKNTFSPPDEYLGTEGTYTYSLKLMKLANIKLLYEIIKDTNKKLKRDAIWINIGIACFGLFPLVTLGVLLVSIFS